MDIVRFFAGLFFAIWSIAGIVVLIGSIIALVFLTQAASLLGKPDIQRMISEGTSEQGDMPSAAKIACATQILGKERVQELLITRNPTTEEEAMLKQCEQYDT